MSTIRRIGILSLAKFLGILYGGLGLIAGLIVTLISLSGSIISRVLSQNPFAQSFQGNSQGPIVSVLFGIGAIIFLPIIYGIFGFLIGIVVGFIANIALRLSGGIQLKLEK
jgi:hypothetical protein